VWSRDERHELVGFDFTSAGLVTRRNGVGCALKVENLSYETVSIRPHSRRGFWARWRGMKMPEYPDLMFQYQISAENKGRARALLGPQVVGAILDWQGQGPPPWVCLSDGMLGLCIERRSAESDRTMRRLYKYARRLRRLLQERVGTLRASGMESGQ